MAFLPAIYQLVKSASFHAENCLLENKGGKLTNVGANVAPRIFPRLGRSEDGGNNIKTLVPSNIAPAVCLSAAALVAWLVWRGRGRRSRSDNGRADRPTSEAARTPSLTYGMEHGRVY